MFIFHAAPAATDFSRLKRSGFTRGIISRMYTELFTLSLPTSRFPIFRLPTLSFTTTVVHIIGFFILAFPFFVSVNVFAFIDASTSNVFISKTKKVTQWWGAFLINLSYLSYDALYVFPLFPLYLGEIRLGGFELLDITIIGIFGLIFIGIFIVILFRLTIAYDTSCTLLCWLYLTPCQHLTAIPFLHPTAISVEYRTCHIGTLTTVLYG